MENQADTLTKEFKAAAAAHAAEFKAASEAHAAAFKAAEQAARDAAGKAKGL